MVVSILLNGFIIITSFTARGCTYASQKVIHFNHFLLNQGKNIWDLLRVLVTSVRVHVHNISIQTEV